MNLRDIRRLVRVAKEDADLVGAILDEHDSMLSPAELAAMYQLIRMTAPTDARVAELGTYLGGTTRLFGEAFRRSGVRNERRIEVYDFFEHNADPVVGCATTRCTTSGTSSRSGRPTPSGTPTWSTCTAETFGMPPPTGHRFGCSMWTSSRATS